MFIAHIFQSNYLAHIFVVCMYVHSWRRCGRYYSIKLHNSKTNLEHYLFHLENQYLHPLKVQKSEINERIGKGGYGYRYLNIYQLEGRSFMDGQ